MIPEKTIIKIKIAYQANYYKKLGYNAILGEELEIETKDLPLGSHVEIPCICDYCGTTKMKPYKDYIESISSQGLYSCKDCKAIKTKVTNMERYGFPSPSCTDEVKEKIANTCMKKFGVKSATLAESVIEKKKKTLLERYGVDHYAKTPEYKEKFANTMLKRYGVEHAAACPIFLEKMKKTTLERYGVECAAQCPEIKEKIKQTNLKKYGVEYSPLREDFGDIMRKNALKKYGVTSTAQLPEVRRKTSMTLQQNQSVATSIQQKYLHQLYGGELNGVVSHFNCDIVFREDHLVLEYDGGGHFLQVEFGKMSEDEFIHKEISRSVYIKSEGYHIVRIISRKDYLPSDSTLLSMLSFAKQFFVNNPERTWLSFDIDNSCIYNAYYKESEGGKPYDYGSLHKLKKSNLNKQTNINQC